MIQSLDRRELLYEIDRRAQAMGITMPALVQVNIAKEPQKSGVFEEDLEAFVREAAKHGGVRVQGLMAIMPLVDDPEEVRPCFRRMRAWFDRLREAGHTGRADGDIVHGHDRRLHRRRRGGRHHGAPRTSAFRRQDISRRDRYGSQAGRRQ